MRISPKAANTDASIMPNGGTKKAVRISNTPKITSMVARTGCFLVFIVFSNIKQVGQAGLFGLVRPVG